MLMNPKFVEIGYILQYKESIDEMKAVQWILLKMIMLSFSANQELEFEPAFLKEGLPLKLFWKWK